VTGFGEFSNIGRFNFGQVFEKWQKKPAFLDTFLESKSFVAISARNGLGGILGDFLTYSPGHPGHD
jgi:hypothetical protein